jgi:hypothetical protein
MGKHERKKPLGKPRNKLQDNIRMNLKEIVWWPSLIWIMTERSGWVCDHSTEPSGAIK